MGFFVGSDILLLWLLQRKDLLFAFTKNTNENEANISHILLSLSYTSANQAKYISNFNIFLIDSIRNEVYYFE